MGKTAQEWAWLIHHDENGLVDEVRTTECIKQAMAQSFEEAKESSAKIFDGFAARMKHIENWKEFHQAEQDAKSIRSLPNPYKESK